MSLPAFILVRAQRLEGVVDVLLPVNKIQGVATTNGKTYLGANGQAAEETVETFQEIVDKLLAVGCKIN